MKLIKVVFCILVLLILVGESNAQAPVVRIKDIARILQARPNQLMGFGLVVGLKRSGDSSQTGFTKQALANLLSRMGVVPQVVIPTDSDFKSRNIAAVMVTATLPPFVKAGDTIDVIVSSVGDAGSLRGGTLLMTPLEGIDGNVYAIAQGSLSVGESVSSHSLGFRPSPVLEQGITTVGRIPNGAIVEKEVSVSIEIAKEEISLKVIKEKGVEIVEEGATLPVGISNLTIVLNNPDFTTASRVAYSIAKAGIDVKAQDAATVLVPLRGDEDLVSLISKIENLTVVPDVVARVVISERTGTVVIGSNVRIMPVAVSYGNVSVEIGDIDLYSYSYSYGQEIEDGAAIQRSRLKAAEKLGKLVELGAGASLRDLVAALNTLGAAPRDLISIIQAIKAAGALSAELEII